VLRKLDQTLDALHRSNEIAGEVRDQLSAEIEAGKIILKSPKPDRRMIDLLLIQPLKYIIDKGAGAIIADLARAALEAVLK
jgi:hypothetical protein